MTDEDDDRKFFKGLRNALLPSLALWAAIGVIVWIVFFIN